MNSCRQWMFLALILLLQLTYWMLFRYVFNHHPWKCFQFLSGLILQKQCDLDVDISSLFKYLLDLVVLHVIQAADILKNYLYFILNVTWLRFLWLYWHVVRSLTIFFILQTSMAGAKYSLSIPYVTVGSDETSVAESFLSTVQKKLGSDVKMGDAVVTGSCSVQKHGIKNLAGVHDIEVIFFLCYNYLCKRIYSEGILNQ